MNMNDDVDIKHWLKGCIRNSVPTWIHNANAVMEHALDRIEELEEENDALKLAIKVYKDG